MKTGCCITGKMLLKFNHFDAVGDIAKQYDLFNLVSDPIREVNSVMQSTICSRL